MDSPSVVADYSPADLNQENAGHGARTTASRPRRPQCAMRTYRIGYLRKDGRPDWTEQIGPAMPVFESAFSSFCHGTLIPTSEGQVAIQDLIPGMEVLTDSHGPMPVLWIGSMTLVPQAPGADGSACGLTRIMPDAFGFGKPETNLMVGPGARLLARPQWLDQGLGHERMLVPARDMSDGMNVIDIAPQRPVTVYHLALKRHAVIRAAGVEMESFHPGAGFERRLSHNMLGLFLSFFPHISKVGDFGNTIYPRHDLPLI